MQVSPASASCDNPDKSCLLRSSWWREGGKEEDTDGGEEEGEELGLKM